MGAIVDALLSETGDEEEKWREIVDRRELGAIGVEERLMGASFWVTVGRGPVWMCFPREIWTREELRKPSRDGWRGRERESMERMEE